MKTIDLEAHFYTKAIFDYLETRKNFPTLVRKGEPGSYDLRFTEHISLFQSQAFIDKLCEIGATRIASMDEAGLDMQVLSFSSPGVDEFEPDHNNAASFAVELNNIIHDAVKRHPDRFLGFATIAPYNISSAVKELERAIKELGFVGWLAHSNFGQGNYLDNQEYWPLLEAAEALNIPIYLHPTTPLTESFGKFGFALAGPALGFQCETALCLLRMIYAGVFDEFPKLTIILGHLGEALPILMPDRIDWAYANPQIANVPGFMQERPPIKRTPSQVIFDNVYMTTSGRFSKLALDYVLQLMGEDSIMLATDYPYENLVQSLCFIRECGLADKTLKKLCSGNAEKLGIIPHFSGLQKKG